jgi:hypothetical protein
MADLSEANLVLSYFKTLIWPVIVLFAIIIFRRPVGTLLGSIEEVEGFGVRAKIGRRLTEAATGADQALLRDPIRMVPSQGPRPNYTILREIAFRMDAALKLTWGHADTNTVAGVRAAVDALNNTVNAILVVVGTSGWRPPGFEESAPGAVPITVIADQLVVLTEYSGWAGVINSRNILRRGVAAICGRAARRVRRDDAGRIIDAVNDTRRRLETLVNNFIDTLNRAA